MPEQLKRPDKPETPPAIQRATDEYLAKIAAANKKGTPEVLINGQPTRSSVEMPYNGRPESYVDFRTAGPGDVVTLLTDKTVVQLEKVEDNPDAMAGWREVGKGAVRLLVTEPSEVNGASLGKPEVAVVRSGQEIGVIDLTETPVHEQTAEELEESNGSRTINYGRVQEAEHYHAPQSPADHSH